MNAGVRTKRVRKREPDASAAALRELDDCVAIEEPLDVRISGDTLAITMRTPGHDRELVLGFLWAEGIIGSPDDVSGLAHCGRSGAEGRENTIEVTLAPGVVVPDLSEGSVNRRGTVVTSACGVCGRRTIDDLLARFTRVRPPTNLDLDVVVGAVAKLTERQPIFAATGGTHAASLVDLSGNALATFEDVGRHNAVDKVVGSQVRARAMPLEDRVLVVSGRASFEIVQKAMAARIPVVASVSAASSLAVELAEAAGITLIGFVRGWCATIYAR
jgi:FdhD protein